MTDAPEVVVVGGGSTGVGVARDLAMRGVDVTLVERSGLNAGTSGRSHGVLHSGARYAESDPEGAAECRAENRVLREIAGECVVDTGGLFVQLSADDPDYFDRKVAACDELGIETDLLDAEALRNERPGLAADVVRGVAVPDGVIYPSRLVAATAAGAREHGATIATHSPVEDVAADEDGFRVDVGGDLDASLSGDAVVNAAGPWAGEVASFIEVNLAMQPTRGVMVAVEYGSLGPVLNRCRAPADGDIAVPHDDHAILGTTSVAVDDPDGFEGGDWEVERTVSECAAMVPGFTDAPVVRTYWGVRPLYEPDEAVGEERGISRDFVVLDHARSGAPGLFSVVGGKLTTHRRMAEATADRVCDHLGVDAACRTAVQSLPGADDASELDRFVAEFDAVGPADSDVVGG